MGVYVGQVSARVRDELWNRILENAKVGRVTMVYQTNNEQHFAYRVHNSEWKPIDFDGLTLMLRPVDEFSNRPQSLRPGFSKAAQRQIVHRIQKAEMKRAAQLQEDSNDILEIPDIISNEKVKYLNDEKPENSIENKSSISSDNVLKTAVNQIEKEKIKPNEYIENRKEQPTERSQKFPRRSATAPILFELEQSDVKKKAKQKDIIKQKEIVVSEDKMNRSYVVIDLETTGLDETEHEIIEFGALRIRNGQIIGKFQCLVCPNNEIPDFISKLTGITNEMVDDEGIELKQALMQFIEFIGNDMIIGHNIEFDMKFIRAALALYRLPMLTNRCCCTLEMSRMKCTQIKSHKLSSLIKYFGIQSSGEHRSLEDCENVFHLYEKLRSLK